MALIEIRKLTKLYRMGDAVVRALDGVDLTIERGEFVAITGASRSGKSTMMHLIGCLDRPTSGTYILNSKNVSQMTDRQLASVRNSEIGFVFQTFNLINRTSAADNVSVPLFYARRGNTRQPAMAALERVGLGRRSHHRPNELSGGERQRVAIARAIVNNPPLLLADEPTGNLDTRTGEQIMEIFHELNAQGVTIVLVTHEHEVAIQAKRIVHMRDGKILWDRLSAEIKEGDFAARPTSTTLPIPPGVLAPGLPDPAARLVPGGGVAVLARPRSGTVARSPVTLETQSAGDFDGGVALANPEFSGAPQGAALDAPNELPVQVRRRPGATSALVCGIVALVAIGAVWLVSKLLVRGIDMSQFVPGKPPPPELMAKYGPQLMASGIVSVVGIVAAEIVAIVGLFMARGALRAENLGDSVVLTGKGKARAGFWLSLIAILLPIGMCFWSVVAGMVFGAGKA